LALIRIKIGEVHPDLAWIRGLLPKGKVAFGLRIQIKFGMTGGLFFSFLFGLRFLLSANICQATFSVRKGLCLKLFFFEAITPGRHQHIFESIIHFWSVFYHLFLCFSVFVAGNYFYFSKIALGSSDYKSADRRVRAVT